MPASKKSATLLCCVAVFLWSCSGGARPAQKTIAGGASLYAVNCSFCHGETGMGDGMAASSMKPPPTRLDSAFLATRTKAELKAAIRTGVTRDGKQTMPPASKLNDVEVTALVEYLSEMARKAEQGK